MRAASVAKCLLTVPSQSHRDLSRPGIEASARMVQLYSRQPVCSDYMQSSVLDAQIAYIIPTSQSHHGLPGLLINHD